MSILIGIIGKPNVGKSTFFSALTENPVEIADYPFTTIESNKGVTYIRAKCPETELGKKCKPNFGKCVNGTRLVPVELIDVAGLVPGAHEGKGLGNKFLDDLRRADGFIQVVDSTGSLDQNGNNIGRGKFDPLEDAEFVHNEIVLWLANIISDGLVRNLRKLESEGGKLDSIIYEKISGLGIDPKDVSSAVKNAGIPSNLKNWDDQVTIRLAEEIIRTSKPRIIVASKADKIDQSEASKLRERNAHVASGDFELVLRKAAKASLIDYFPGDTTFKIIDETKLNNAQKNALNRVREFMDCNGGTRTQEAIEDLVYKVLGMIVVYPVEDENHWTDKNGNILPDAILLRRGSTAIDLAYKVHSDLGDRFIRAINGRTKRALGRDYVLEDGDVIKIIASR
ncbi:MAG: redox-regulated ATPase YchF [Thermoplasmatales archaeon]|nr:redox-regulated ATPase YchF [Candidatus Thermoplasmatota archaeon]MDA8055010.1 redox-regulated ATPase YchF [Thermoplasmatales archaeon]